MALGDNADKRQRNWQCERAIQTEGGKFESYAYNRHDDDAQEQYNADSVDKPVVDPNNMVTGNINNRNQSLSSNLIINED